MAYKHLALRAPILPGLCAALLGACGGTEPPAASAPAATAAVSEPQRNPEAWPSLNPAPLDPANEAFVDGLLARMPLEEKVGQVLQGELGTVTPDDVRRYHLGSVLNGGGSTPNHDKHATAADWLAMADAYYDASVDASDGGQPIPVMWGSDAVHGHSNVFGATIFPHNIGLGAADDPELLQEIGAATAIEMLTTGLDWTFAPTVAVVRDDRWGRTYEGYSEDPRIVAAYARAIIEGLQGVPGTPEYLGDDKILATTKHFLGDGGTFEGRDQGDNRSSEQELVRIHSAGYQAAIEAGVRTIMASFSSWQGEKLHGSHYLLTTVLKERMGFNGFVVGDWNAHGQVPGCSNDSCAAAFNAGIDMFMAPQDFRELYEHTLEQVRSGVITEARLDDAVRRILRVKAEAGLFERGRPSSRPHAGRQENLGAPAHRAVARRAVRESLVLLKNNGGLLPLAPGQKVLVTGDGADNIGKQTGGWTLSWQGTGNSNEDFPGATSIYGGVRAAVEAGGGSVELAESGQYRERPDVAIVVFGEDPYAEFQGDRAELMYEDQDGPDLKLLRSLKSQDIPVVAVFLSGRPLWVNPHLNASDAFVAAWLPGSEGEGIADLLFRQPDGSMPYGFTGRLSYSWPQRADQFELNVGDADYDPLFPYGFGLSYQERADLGTLSEDSGLAAGEAGPAGVYFSGGRALSGFSVQLGSDQASLAALQGLEQAGSPSVLMTDREVQGDASLLSWQAGQSGWFVIATDGGPLDLDRESNGQLALSLALKVVAAPAEPLMIGMRDATGRTAQLDLGPLLGDATEWSNYRILLKCFADRGLDMHQITAPLELYTTGAAQIALSEGPGLVPGAVVHG